MQVLRFIGKLVKIYYTRMSYVCEVTQSKGIMVLVVALPRTLVLFSNALLKMCQVSKPVLLPAGFWLLFHPTEKGKHS